MRAIFTLSMLGLALAGMAQCSTGEVEVYLEVTTDDYGYETYWQLVPGGLPCGSGTVAEGGNPTMNCSAGGWQLQDPSGYGNNTLYTEGPWCLDSGAVYDLYSVDDWGDGQAAFEVFVDGVSTAQFQQPGATNVFSFIAQLPLALDASLAELTTSVFNREGLPVTIAGGLKNLGTSTITSFDLNYSIDGGTPVSAPITGVSIAQWATYEFAHPVQWPASGLGPHAVEVWASNINGSPDMNPANDLGSTGIQVTPAIPDIIDQYLIGTPQLVAVASSNEDLLVPRDLDFHPDPARNELWVINKDVEATGGSTVKFTDPGDPGMTFLWQRDPNAWHFMSLPTGIAFGDNGNFSTSPGVFDANHNGGTPFTGISLWSSDPAIYAQNIFGPLGSHLDMLHVTPNSQGIAHERWNRYWVVDGFNGDVVMHDFKGDHGPGNDYHGNAVIRRYDEDQITRDPNDHVVSHCAYDKATGWLYVVDFGGQRVFRIDTHTGAVSGPGDYGPWESYVEYSMVSGYTQEAVVGAGLVEPAGIDVLGDRMIVSDHANGDIILFDISTLPALELGRIHTLQPGIMGVAIGPDGHIWYVNATTNELVRVDLDANVGVADDMVAAWSVVPNPADDRVRITGGSWAPNAALTIHDATGREVLRATAGDAFRGLDVTRLASGSYTARCGGTARPFLIRR